MGAAKFDCIQSGSQGQTSIVGFVSSSRISLASDVRPVESNIQPSRIPSPALLSSATVQECPIGKDLFSSTSEMPEKKAKQEVTREKGKHMFHKVVTGSSPENLKSESFSHINSNESLLKELPNDGLFGDNGVPLTEILDGLASLDQNGFFSNPMDNSFAVDCSKINNACFSVMREKIQSKYYKTWRSFVDDFEDICHNAMSYQEKGSMIWEAASTLLDKGKRYLDQYANRAIKFFGLHTKLEHRSPCDHGASSNGHYKIETMVHQEGESSFLKSSKEHGAVLHGKCNNLPNQNSVNVLGNSDMTDPHLDESFQNFPGSTLLCTQNMISVQEQDECRSNAEATFDMIEANTQVDDLNVEILDCTGDGNRFNPINQATECSSSFGGTEVDIADDDDSGCKMYDAAEIESDLRNGNGAAIAPEYDSGGFQKRKKALRDDWKHNRRCIQWRCQWLELRVKEVLSRASNYDRLLADVQAKKQQKGGGQAMDAMTTITSPQIDQKYRHQVFQRKRRKKVESMVELSAYMSHHPLFSFYEKKRLDAEAVPLDDDCYSILIEVHLVQLYFEICDWLWLSRSTGAGEVNDAGLNENDYEGPMAGQEYKNGDNSLEHMLVHIETLQSRILKLKNQLSKFCSGKVGTVFPGNISSSFLTAGSSKCVLQSTAPTLGDSSRIQTTVGGGSKLNTGPNISYQQNSDSEFCHSVMPCNPTSSYVELAQHEFIETPDWRFLVSDAILDLPEKEDSSDEVTDEEAYKQHHALMEVKEKKHRDFPLRGTKRFEGESILGKGTSHQQTTEAIESEVGQTGGENISNICLPFDLFVPKCKRKKAHSRSSSLQKVEGLHAVSVEDPNSSSLQDHDMNEVKMENKEGTVGDENRHDL
ncbi:uncharacterized protein LOC131043949 isoform X1 [Cryptomeria japonica]|uniref:uncharacterized protein LOC131043949 isoform X1 n=2 Tax=Cryptomeria japonica TaxID=3369 RepID=UPI0025AC1E52|nr:uncharacterized protein LOC131043949 isoform X1 [Cryptomeria japonica]XP_057833187.1 uncharacterized protein LOC131043949 isoform X1 [Cryptomeria japonica]XP_057833188.1 uncharacterized protein LOC131043949 isoform X1 [Cryptomeria japonica]